MSIFDLRIGKPDWAQKRCDIVSAFEKHVYGVRPKQLDGVTLTYTVLSSVRFDTHTLETVQMTYKSTNMRFALFLPIDKRPLPAFVYLMHPYQQTKIDICKGEGGSYIPIDEIIHRGFALAVLLAGDLAGDREGGDKTGIFCEMEAPRDAESWGVISAWAWGLSKVTDYLYTRAEIDKTHIASVGHSRGGKTALWAAATDERFCLAISNCSGNTGAALSRGNTGETVKNINDAFPTWFCGTYKNYNDNENALPVDQHQLIASIAPRNVYVASAREDAWADPDGELLSAKLASTAWGFYGKKGLVIDTPEIGTGYHDGGVAYHVLSGGHAIKAESWRLFMDYFSSIISRSS